MTNTIDAYCTECETFTWFLFDGEDWESQNCEAYNTQQ